MRNSASDYEKALAENAYQGKERENKLTEEKKKARMLDDLEKQIKQIMDMKHWKSRQQLKKPAAN